MSYQLEHVIDVLRRDGHTIVLDVEEAMCGGRDQHLPSDVFGRS